MIATLKITSGLIKHDGSANAALKLRLVLQVVHDALAVVALVRREALNGLHCGAVRALGYAAGYSIPSPLLSVLGVVVASHIHPLRRLLLRERLLILLIRLLIGLLILRKGWVLLVRLLILLPPAAHLRVGIVGVLRLRLGEVLLLVGWRVPTLRWVLSVLRLFYRNSTPRPYFDHSTTPGRAGCSAFGIGATAGSARIATVLLSTAGP